MQQYQIRKEIKHRIKDGIPEEDLILLKLPTYLSHRTNSGFQWIHNREFRYQGKMYDVVRRMMYGDTIWYYCLADEKETQLFVHLDELVKQELDKNSERKQQIEKILVLLNSLFFLSFNDSPLIQPEREFDLIHYVFKPKTWIVEPPTPPPNI
jgi:hypothetical protein